MEKEREREQVTGVGTWEGVGGNLVRNHHNKKLLSILLTQIILISYWRHNKNEL